MEEEERLSFKNGSETAEEGLPSEESESQQKSNLSSRMVALLKVLDVIRYLESEGAVSCACAVDFAAEYYYGVPRIQYDWIICVPAAELEKANTLMLKQMKNDGERYEAVDSCKPGRLYSLHHIFRRYKIPNSETFFIITPDEDSHFVCKPENLTKSSRSGMPYPSLASFLQSAVDRNDPYTLGEVIDGMDLSEDWGWQNLDLSGSVDLEWIKRKNQRIRESLSLEFGSSFLEIGEVLLQRKDLWEGAVRGKERRMAGGKYPKELFKTQYRLHSSPDPTQDADRPA